MSWCKTLGVIHRLGESEGPENSIEIEIGRERSAVLDRFFNALYARRPTSTTMGVLDMRKEYGAALREVFADQLASAAPGFILVKNHSPLAGFPGERAFCSLASEAVFNWVVLVPDQKREAFFIELGWSRKGRFPQLAMRPSGIRPEEAGSEEEYLCRLGELSRGSDLGWLIEELDTNASHDQMLAYIVAQTRPISADVARNRVVPCVQKALRELVQYGLPFLHKHAKPDAAGQGTQRASEL